MDGSFPVAVQYIEDSKHGKYHCVELHQIFISKLLPHKRGYPKDPSKAD
jgi:hypothetical protein